MILWPKRAASDEAANAQDEYCRQVAEGVHGVEALFDEQLRLLWISPSIERVTVHGRPLLAKRSFHDSL